MANTQCFRSMFAMAQSFCKQVHPPLKKNMPPNKKNTQFRELLEKRFLLPLRHNFKFSPCRTQGMWIGLRMQSNKTEAILLQACVMSLTAELFLCFIPSDDSHRPLSLRISLQIPLSFHNAQQKTYQHTVVTSCRKRQEKKEVNNTDMVVA